MKSFEFDRWDAGRLLVNRSFAGLLRACGLTTFDAFNRLRDEQIVKRVRPERATSRFVLEDENGSPKGFYIKRFGPPPWKEYIKPLLRLTWPILGARNEWTAITAFHAAGLRTMIPVASGESRRYSFLVTEAIEDFEKLSEWLPTRYGPGSETGTTLCERGTLDAVARTARRMHDAGMHHQDFYLGHLMRPTGDPNGEICVIDLGRVRRRAQLGQRWIIKDLAQLHYSAQLVSRSDRLRFLRTYLGRRIQSGDGDLIRRIRRKSARIARHARRHAL